MATEDERADHDNGYRKLFGNPQIVRDLLEHYLQPPWLAQVDLDAMTRLNASFTGPRLVRREGDVIWRLPGRDGPDIFVLLMLEFQSSPHPWMALRMALYVLLLYDQLIHEGVITTQTGLPLVMPLVIYNGERTWHSATSLRELRAYDLDPSEVLWPYQVNFQYTLLDELHTPHAELIRHPSLMARLMALEQSAITEMLYDRFVALARWAMSALDESARTALQEWVNGVIIPVWRDHLAPDDIARLSRDFTEESSMLSERIARMMEREMEEKIELRVESIVNERALESQRQLVLKLAALRFGNDANLAWLTPLLVDQDACFAWMERITLATSYEALRTSL